MSSPNEFLTFTPAFLALYTLAVATVSGGCTGLVVIVWASRTARRNWTNSIATVARAARREHKASACPESPTDWRLPRAEPRVVGESRRERREVAR